MRKENIMYAHECGLMGFGQSIHDMCRACRYRTYRSDGYSHKEAVIRTKRDYNQSLRALFPFHHNR